MAATVVATAAAKRGEANSIGEGALLSNRFRAPDWTDHVCNGTGAGEKPRLKKAATAVLVLLTLGLVVPVAR